MTEHIFITGPRRSGKTTLASVLEGRFRMWGRSLIITIDAGISSDSWQKKLIRDITPKIDVVLWVGIHPP